MKSNEAIDNIDPRKVKKYCYKIGDFKHAVCIAVECRRIDRVQQCIELYSLDCTFGSANLRSPTEDQAETEEKDQAYATEENK